MIRASLRRWRVSGRGDDEVIRGEGGCGEEEASLGEVDLSEVGL